MDIINMTEVPLDHAIKNEEPNSNNINFKSSYKNEEDHNGLSETVKFNPPAYIQRYEAVEKVLKDERFRGKIKKIVDFGCGECSFYKYVKQMEGIEEVLFVDQSIADVWQGIERCGLIAADFMVQRKRPLFFKFAIGCVTHKDPMLLNTDALVCIEVIEHLHEETIIKLVFNVFSFIKPKVAIFTTPNSEFNVLFTNMKLSNNMRHYDHKFEWTRQQFQDWANNIVQRYPEYKVEFQDIAKGPPEVDHLGGCSQMAIFYKATDSDPCYLEEPPGEPKYSVQQINEISANFVEDTRTEEEKILHESVYGIHFLATLSDYDDVGFTNIFLKDVIVQMKNNPPTSIEEISRLLEQSGWKISFDESNEPYVVYPPEGFESESDSTFLSEEDCLQEDRGKSESVDLCWDSE